MIDYIKARQEYQSWLRKGGDEIDWSSDRYGVADKLEFEIHKDNTGIYFGNIPDAYYFNCIQEVSREEEIRRVRILKGMTNVFFKSIKETQEECKKFLRKFIFKQLTGDDLVE